MKYRVIKYKDDYNNVYTTEPIPSFDIKRKIRNIQETNDNKAVIISIEEQVMTRREEIEQEMCKIKFANFYRQDGYEFGFQQGAEWADRTMLNRIYKVIEEMLPNYVELDYVFDEISVNYHKFKNNFISDLRKALEQ